MSHYTYTIFDANPQTSSGTAWPSHDDIDMYEDSDAAAVAKVRDTMSIEAAGLSPSDDYEVGQSIYAIVWDDEGTIVEQLSYELTREDLGVPTEEERAAERLDRAAKHLDASHIGDDKWAHYDDSMNRWYVVDADELAELCDYLDDEDEQVSKDAYSHWCAGTTGQEMPEGWDPGEGDRA